MGKSKSSFSVRQKVVHQYQEQGNELDVVFQCRDGEQRCSRVVLNFMSDYYTEQLDARQRMGNPLVFNYDYQKCTIKQFLDMMHEIDVELDLVESVEMIKFLKFEAKSDESQFEKKLLGMVCDGIQKMKLSLETKLLICLISNTFDNFDGFFEEPLLSGYSDESVLVSLLQLDLKNDQNKRLKKLLTTEDSAEMDDQIETQMYALAKKLRKNEISHKPMQLEEPPTPIKRDIKFYQNDKHQFSEQVDMSQSVDQLIRQVSRRNAYYYGDFRLECAKMYGKLDKYEFKDGDRVDIVRK